VNIRYIKHNEIDFKKWDKCIKKAINGSIYGYSWFLNTVSATWDALIDENYENVMPLTYRSILGLKVLCQPHFATNLGVYSSQILECETVNRFIAAIPDEFRYIRINLNKYNKLTIDNLKIKRDIHYELDLIESYEKIQRKYSENLKQKIALARQHNVSVVPSLNSSDLVHLFQKSKTKLWNLVFPKRVHDLKMLVSTAIRYRVGQVYGAYANGNNLCAAAFIIFSHQKATLLFLGFNKIALKQHALEIIIDEFIKLQAEQNLTLRFEFASRKKFAGIYTGFGGRRYQFMNIRQNRLLRIIKFMRL
jgi:hypothetical protein